MTNKQLAVTLTAKIKKAAGRGLDRARHFLVQEVKKALSRPTPRKKVLPGDGSPPYYRATTPATAGAPPRLVNGTLRDATDSRRDGESRVVILNRALSRPSKKAGVRFAYGRFHEVKGLGKRSGEHPFILPTVRKNVGEVRRLVGAEVRAELGG